MSSKKLVPVLGHCAGHPEHPEMLWMFERIHGSKLRLLRVETDFAPPKAPTTQFVFQKFYVDMKAWKQCPYCEASLYFFCKQCNSLSCFSWQQVGEDEQGWCCPSCNTAYKMRPKTTPFQVSAVVDQADSSATSTNLELPPLQEGGSLHSTHQWHPAKK